MKDLYIVYHFNKTNEHTKMIGMYGSLQKAEEIVAAYKIQNGFKETPNGFFIDQCPIDTLFWKEGYCYRTIGW